MNRTRIPVRAVRERLRYGSLMSSRAQQNLPLPALQQRIDSSQHAGSATRCNSFSTASNALAEDDLIHVDRKSKPGVAFVCLNRPRQRNALNNAMLMALSNELKVIASDKSENAPRCVVISGNGPAFCSGHDLKEIKSQQLTNNKESCYRQLFELCSNVMMQITNMPQPVIAQVHGVATAAGCQLVASCDLAIAENTTVFATPGVNIGLFCSTPSVPLIRHLSRKHAMQMLLTGDFIDADTAQMYGLVSDVVPEDKLKDTVVELAEKIASKSSTAISLGKRAINAYSGQPLDKSYEIASEAMVSNMLLDDAEEGIGAFLDKRHPIWDWEK